MLNANPRSTVSVGGRPLHAMLVPIPIFCFVATLITDIVYWQTAAMLWGHVRVAAARRADRVAVRGAAWIHGIGNVAALILSIFNCMIHTRDAYSSVVPSGLILSALVVVILPTAISRRTVFKRRWGARRAGPGSGARLFDLGPRRCLLWLAVQLLRPTCRSARPTAATGSGRKGHSTRLRVELARCAIGARVLFRDRSATDASAPPSDTTGKPSARTRRSRSTPRRCRQTHRRPGRAESPCPRRPRRRR